MTTTAADIIARAQDFSPLNVPLTSDIGEMLSRIRADQKALFSAVASQTIDYFQTTQSLTSSGGSSARVFDLTALTAPLERILVATLQDGRELNQVDIRDTDAELAPRYTVRGRTLVEVGNDWGSSGTKTATFVYVFGPTDISPTGNTTQTVSLPDEWTDLLVLPLAMYLFQKDPGRDPAEYDRLTAMNDDRQQMFLAYLQTFGGVESKRFIQVTPLVNTGKK